MELLAWGLKLPNAGTWELQSFCPLGTVVGSGLRYQILLHVFACCANQKTHRHTRIAQNGNCTKRVKFSHVRVFSDLRAILACPLVF